MNRRSFLAGAASAPALAVPSASKSAASEGPFAWSGPPPAGERVVWTNVPIKTWTIDLENGSLIEVAPKR